MKTFSPLLLPLLRSKAQGEVMACLFLDPTRQLSLSEIAAETGVSLSSVMREVNRLEHAGLVSSTQRGHSRIIKVDRDNAIYGPLSELIALSFGPLAVLPAALADVDGIEEAFIFGSWAARYNEQPGTVPGDIDVMVIGDADRDLLYEIAADASRTLRREVNIRRMTRSAWDDPANKPFRNTVESRPVVALKETE